ncbi:hypothetical protein [Mucilaginibacter gotjawali]|uniref:Uncharacterized protein n=2 Tax=Mucilaginibacter gotjawali TaxID=1550579 RepID=A0A110B5M2_9SPHI|nr:hypothetical protein [Mucilaginibacter gotjawali]MBB3055704.1 hypothetical protein [Mucilaginibacter gotjawali]BAU54523.1 hypothetical protein MgSA37_02699 [Mucilaginibacter gotjawali]
MIDRGSLKEKYATMATDDLLEITSNKSDYTELAVSVALEELKKRNVAEAEIKSYVSVLAYKPDQTVINNHFVDLNIFHKVGNYTLVIPIIKHRAYSDFCRYTGFALKKRQANYYLVTGTTFLIIAIILAANYQASFLLIWASGFSISFLFDIGYNKTRQIGQIREKVDEGKDPEAVF